MEFEKKMHKILGIKEEDLQNETETDLSDKHYERYDKFEAKNKTFTGRKSLRVGNDLKSQQALKLIN